MLSIPVGLQEQVERGNVLLFIGERVVRDANGQVFIDQLTTKLAVHCNAKAPEEYTFAEASQVYEDLHGRHALVEFVRNEVEQLGDQPQRVHRLIAGFSHSKVLVTTCFDQRLERACADAGRSLHRVVGNIEIAFDDERKTRLYKLRGSIERVDSLVLTEEDYERFFDEHASMSVVLKAHLASKSILFLGYDLADAQFQTLYRHVTELLDTFARRAYAFGEAPNQRVSRWCQRHGIEVVESGAADFLEALSVQLAERHASLVDSGIESSITLSLQDDSSLAPLPRRPYKLLAHYESTDAHIFFGRAHETQQLTSLIHAHRLVLFFGTSGTGKSSLLLAGVIPLLDQSEPTYETLYVRGRIDPIGAIQRSMERLLPDADLPKQGSLVDLIRSATTFLERPIVILLDQFEEFFSHSEAHQSRTLFIEQLALIVEELDLPIKFVFSLREDWLASMSEFEDRIPDIFRVKMRLLPLTRQQASLAITQPIKHLGIEYEPALVGKLLDDLIQTHEDNPLIGASTGVMPPQLQLVCNSLFERARQQQQHWIGTADYEAIGGGEGILARHLAEALKEHPREQEKIARTIMTALVTDRAMRTWVSLDDIITYTGEGDSVVKKVLDRLIRQRLVLRLDDDQTYELTHDILASTIAAWSNDEDRKVKQVQALIRRELNDWKNDPNLLPSLTKFENINHVRERLRLNEEEERLLLWTSLLYDIEIPYWLSKVGEDDCQKDYVLAMLKNESSQARSTAAEVLSEFDGEEVIEELVHLAISDPERSVRMAAAESLGKRWDPAGIGKLVSLASAGTEDDPRRAMQALAVIQDIDINRPVGTGVQRLPVVSALAKMRLGRNLATVQAALLTGAVGGAIGFALGYPPVLTLQYANIYGVQQALLDFPSLFIQSIFWGIPAGVGVVAGLTIGLVLLPEREILGRLLGSVLLGSIGFTMGSLQLGVLDSSGFIIHSIGISLFGALAAAGVAIPTSDRRLIYFLSSALGAMFGILFYAPFIDPALLASPLHISILAASGAILGLVLAVTISWTLARWPVQRRRETRTFRTSRIPEAAIPQASQLPTANSIT